MTLHDPNDGRRSTEPNRPGPTITRRGALRTAAGATLGASLLATASAAQDASVDELWSFEMEGEAWTSPTVVDGTVYIASDDSREGTLYAIDASDGTERWSHESVDRIDSTPFVTDDTVFFGNNDGTLFALDAADGSERWTLEELRYLSSPTGVDGTIFVVGTNTVYAFDVQDGTEKWRFETNVNLTSPVVADGTVVVGANDSRVDGDDAVYALDAEDGSERWTFEDGNQIGEFAPTVADGTVFVTDHIENAVYALGAEDGSDVWEAPVSGPRTPPTVADGAVVVGTTNVDAGLVALDVEDGSEAWTFEGETLFESTFEIAPTVVDGVVLSADGADDLYAVDLTEGTKVWHASPDNYESGFSKSFPTVVDGTVYIGSDTGHVLALETGLDGSSEDSRVLLGTFGHHDVAANAATTGEDSSGEGTEDEDGADESESSEETNQDTSSSEVDGSDDTDDDGMPGFGLGGALASIGGTAYLLRRRSTGRNSGP